MAAPVKITLRVRHKPKDTPTGVADTDDVVAGAVGVGGVGCGGRGPERGAVTKSDLPILAEAIKHGLVTGNQASLTVGNREHHRVRGIPELLLKTLRPDADAVLNGVNRHPPVDEPAAAVEREADLLLGRLGGPGLAGGGPGQKPGLHGDLEPVADGEDRTTPGDRVTQRGVEVLLEPEGEDASAGDIVAVREAAGKADEVGAFQGRRIGDQGVEVNNLGDRAGKGKSACQFTIAVGARGADDQGTRRGGPHGQAYGRNSGQPRLRAVSCPMPPVHPFRAVQYASAVSGSGADVSSLVAPPYDVLDAESKTALQARSDRNIVTIDLPHIPAKDLGPPEAYRAAALKLEEWLTDGTLVKRDHPAMFCYRETFEFNGATQRRTGMACTLDVRAFGPAKGGGILPHEQTFSGPKEDRLALMKATRCQLSPIFGLHQDESGAAATLMDRVCSARQPDVTATTADGTRHELWTIDDDATIAAYRDALSGEDIFIADGHHRYNTALNYLHALEKDGKVPPDHPARRCMFVLVSMSDAGLMIGPTHRVLGGMADYSFQAFVQQARGELLITALRPHGEDGLRSIGAAMEKGARKCGKNVLGLYDFASRCAYLATPVEPDPLAFDKRFAGMPHEWRTLDVALCQHLIVEKFCQPLARGTGKGKAKEPIKWAFPHSIDEVIDIGTGIERSSGGGKGFTPQLAVIVRPTPLESVRIISRENELMPQKSTFFYPKLATGLFLNPIG